MTMITNSSSVPAFGTMTHHECGCSDWLPDPAIVDQLAAGLQSTAEERIGGAPDAQAFLRGEIEQRTGFVARDGERFFIVDVLAGVQHCQRHRSGIL
jgi:hypothetical protein